MKYTFIRDKWNHEHIWVFIFWLCIKLYIELYIYDKYKVTQKLVAVTHLLIFPSIHNVALLDKPQFDLMKQIVLFSKCNMINICESYDKYFCGCKKF